MAYPHAKIDEPIPGGIPDWDDFRLLHSVVQLGSFASRANAERLARQVRAGGFNVSVSRASAGRRLFRVRVGPAHDREAASQLAAKLRAAGHDGSIVPK